MKLFVLMPLEMLWSPLGNVAAFCQFVLQIQ
jgi:hypothetical protein